MEDHDVYRELSWVVVPVSHTNKINSTPASLTIFKSILTKFYPESKCESRLEISVYQLIRAREPEVLGKECQVQEKIPITLHTNSSEPLIVIFQNILYRPDRQYIRFYWNMEKPPNAFSGTVRMSIDGKSILILLVSTLTTTTALLLGVVEKVWFYREDPALSIRSKF